GLVGDEAAQHEQHESVDGGGEDLGPLVAEGAPVGRGSGGDPDRDEGESDPEGVGDGMSGVGEQGQASAVGSADGLHDRDGEHHPQDDRQAAAVGGPGGHVSVVVPGTHVHTFLRNRSATTVYTASAVYTPNFVQ